MQIKYNYLSANLDKNLYPLYCLAGQENYLIENSLNSIKNKLKQQFECDQHTINIQTAKDWEAVLAEINSYSIFAATKILTINYEIKSLDNSAKKFISDFILQPGSSCFIIMRCPNLPSKQLQWFHSLDRSLLILHYNLNALEMKNWIISKLKERAFSFDKEVPELIQQYTQGNLMACAQVIEKLELCLLPPAHVSYTAALNQISNQAEHNLYELLDAGLCGNLSQAIFLIRQAANNKTEATLVLWMCTQEIRVLLQLHSLINQGKDFKSACAQLKIWPQRVKLYQAGLKRLTVALLRRLIHFSLIIDGQIKSQLNEQAWYSLEGMLYAFCSGNDSLCIE